MKSPKQSKRVFFAIALHRNKRISGISELTKVVSPNSFVSCVFCLTTALPEGGSSVQIQMLKMLILPWPEAMDDRAVTATVSVMSGWLSSVSLLLHVVLVDGYARPLEVLS